MTRVRKLARRLGQRVKIGILRGVGALHLRFGDASTLWLSQSGAGLAGPTQVASEAHRFAKAYAQEVGWFVLADRANWLVPQPCKPGDWLAAPETHLPAIQEQVLRAATIERFDGSKPDLDMVLSRSLGIATPMPLISPMQVPRRHFLLFTKACVAALAEGLALQIKTLEERSRDNPDMMVLSFDQSNSNVKAYTPEQLLVALRKRFTASPREVPEEPVAEVAVTEPEGNDTAEFSEYGDDIGPQP